MAASRTLERHYHGFDGDLGYVVNYAASEPYTVANVAGLRAQTSLHQIELGDDILRLPILVSTGAAE